MQNLIQSIIDKKSVVVWNPFKNNDSLTSEEFLFLIKLRGYSKVTVEGNFITAYQPGVKLFGYETLSNYISGAIKKNLNILVAILEEEMIHATGKIIS